MPRWRAEEALEVATILKERNEAGATTSNAFLGSLRQFDVARRERMHARDDAHEEAPPSPGPTGGKPAHDEESTLPTFFIGFALILGFVLMFLIDRLPRHATDTFQSAPATRHISLDNLAPSSGPVEEESQGFLGNFNPTPKQSRSLATTTGLVIHAAADGIAMGASATTANMKLGLIIFVAIMIHKAPAAFGLTSVLLKQGLSKRAARGHLIVFSLAAPFGAIGTYLLVSLLGGGNMEGESGEWWTGMLLLFSAGTFL
jgi:solute carrier family 39 (zinc transporter), member 9